MHFCHFYNSFYLQSHQQKFKPILQEYIMQLIKKIVHQVNDAKNKLKNIYHKVYNPEIIEMQKRFSFKNIDQNKDLLRSSLKFSTYAPLIIQSYIWLYSIYSIYTIIKTIILIPIQILMGLTNISMKILKLYTTQYVTMHSIVLLTVTYIITLNQDILDVSFMYHLIRGQSTIKVYAVVFALESCEIVLTKLGVFLHQNIQSKLTSKDIPFYKLIPQYIIECLYVLLHSYALYIDFLIYSVVLNSSMESFVIFWSVIYLTKMKSAPSLGLDTSKYKDTLTEDSKYRVNKFIYLILFQISQFNVLIPSFGLKLLFILFVEEAMILIKHMMYLLSSYKGQNDRGALQIRQKMFKVMYLQKNISSIDRCIDQNFSVLPIAVVVFKVLHIVIYSNWKPNFTVYFTFYAILLIIMLIFLTLIILIKYFEQFAKKKIQNNQEPNIFFNSLCIDVIGRMLQQKDKRQDEISHQTNQNQFQKNINLSKLKRGNSLLQSLFLTIDINTVQNKQPNQDSISNKTENIFTTFKAKQK